MLHIYYNKRKKLEVAFKAPNGKILNTSNPQQYEEKDSCYKSIISQMKYFGGLAVDFQDNTEPKPIRYTISLCGHIEVSKKRPVKKYLQAWENKKPLNK